MKRKLLALLLCLALLLTVLPQLALDAHAFETEGDCSAKDAALNWSYADGTLTITGTGDMADYDAGFQPWQVYQKEIRQLSLPEGLTRIGSEAFYGCTALTSVSLPENLTEIGDRAFGRCEALTELSLGNAVTLLGEGAFEGCKGIKTLTLGTGLEDIGADCFRGCEALSTVMIPAKVTQIGDGAFADCGSLSLFTLAEGNEAFSVGEDGCLYSIDGKTLVQFPGGKESEYALPEGVEQVLPQAFRGAKLSSLKLNDTVTEVERLDFRGCDSLGAFSVNETNPNYNCEDGLLKNPEGTTLLRVPTGQSGEFAIPAGITKLADGAFRDCAGISVVKLSVEVTELGEQVFRGCKGLTKFAVNTDNPSFAEQEGVLYDKEKTTLICCPAGMEDSFEIPDSVNVITDCAFTDCTKLTAFEVGTENTAFSVKDDVLFNKEGTTLLQYPGGKEGKYLIPDTTTAIGPHAFTGCEGLTEVTIPEKVTELSDALFRDCVNLEALTIPTGVTKIGEDAFQNCPKLTHVCYGGEESEFMELEIGAGNADLWHAPCYHWKVSVPLEEHMAPQIVAPGCETGGYTSYSCSCGYHFEDTPTDPVGHDWGEPEWTWHADHSASAVFTCKHDASHKQTLTASVTSVTTDPTCSSDGRTVYTAKLSFNGKEYTSTNSETLPTDGHDWGEPVWTWSGYSSTSGYSNVRATFTCKTNSTHQDSRIATVTAETTKAGCETDGKLVYTAKVSFNGKDYTDTKTETLARTGHSWGTASYEWSRDYKTCTGTRVCRNDSTHKQTRTVQSTSRTTATCTAKGTTTYTATFTESGYSTQTKSVETAALGHNYVSGVCSRCGAKQPASDDLPHTGLGSVNASGGEVLQQRNGMSRPADADLPRRGKTKKRS